MKPRLLVTGMSGFLGWSLCRQARATWQVCGTAHQHPVSLAGVECLLVDLCDRAAVEALFDQVDPDGVVHTAASSVPNYCQQHPLESSAINVEATQHLAVLCAARDVPLVFTSTDLVFDGRQPPYCETDPVGPVNIYGQQKVEAEERVRHAHPQAAICRMPLMFGPASPASGSFLQFIVAAAQKGDTLRLFVDEFRTPASATTAAAGLLMALEWGGGLFHLGGAERVSRYEFGLLALEILGFSAAAVESCLCEEVVMSAPRAPDVSLNSDRARALGYAPLALREELTRLVHSGELAL